MTYMRCSAIGRRTAKRGKEEDGGQGRNRTTDTRIFSRRSAIHGLINQSLAELAKPQTRPILAHSWHTQSQLGTFLTHRLILDSGARQSVTRRRYGLSATTLSFSQT